MASAQGMETLKWLSCVKESKVESKSSYFKRDGDSSNLRGEPEFVTGLADWKKSSRVVVWEPVEPTNKEQRQALENVGLCVRWLDAYFDGSLLTADPPVTKPPLAIPTEGRAPHATAWSDRLVSITVQ